MNLGSLLCNFPCQETQIIQMACINDDLLNYNTKRINVVVYLRSRPNHKHCINIWPKMTVTKSHTIATSHTNVGFINVMTNNSEAHNAT